jgi:hypothetical protein
MIINSTKRNVERPPNTEITPCKNSKFSKVENTGPSQTNIDSLVGPVGKESAYLLINFTAYTRRYSWRQCRDVDIYLHS